MRFNLAILSSLLLGSAAAAVVDPEVAGADPAETGVILPGFVGVEEQEAGELWKRRGGGGGGGRGGGSSGGGSRGGSSGGGSRGSSGSGGSSRGGSGGGSGRSPSDYSNTRSTSNSGGYSRPGTGPQPSYVGGTYYGGGAKVPFTAGKNTPSGVSARGPVTGSAIGYWPGVWYYPPYVYGPYGYHYGYYNRSSNREETRQIVCGCAQYSECMCDEVKDDDFWDELIGDGDYSKLNKSIVDVTRRRGNVTIVINGTLPNGTTAQSDDEDDYKQYLVNSAASTVGKAMGLWPLVAFVMGAVYLV